MREHEWWCLLALLLAHWHIWKRFTKLASIKPEYLHIQGDVLIVLIAFVASVDLSCFGLHRHLAQGYKQANSGGVSCGGTVVSTCSTVHKTCNFLCSSCSSFFCFVAHHKCPELTFRDALQSGSSCGAGKYVTQCSASPTCANCVSCPNGQYRTGCGTSSPFTRYNVYPLFLSSRCHTTCTYAHYHIITAEDHVRTAGRVLLASTVMAAVAPTQVPAATVALVLMASTDLVALLGTLGLAQIA